MLPNKAKNDHHTPGAGIFLRFFLSLIRLPACSQAGWKPLSLLFILL